MYKVVIFDFFGVLHEDPLKTWQATLGDYDKHALAAVARKLDTGAITYSEYLAQLAEVSGQPQAIIEQHAEQATLYTSTVKIVKHLSDRMPVGLLSNAHHDELTPILDRHGLKPLFHDIVISSDTKLAKPDPAIFRHALERLGVTAEETVFIDDSPTNVEAARTVGLQALLFKNAKQLKADLEIL